MSNLTAIQNEYLNNNTGLYATEIATLIGISKAELQDWARGIYQLNLTKSQIATIKTEIDNIILRQSSILNHMDCMDKFDRHLITLNDIKYYYNIPDTELAEYSGLSGTTIADRRKCNTQLTIAQAHGIYKGLSDKYS